MTSQEFSCPVNSLCLPYESYSDFLHELSARTIAPAVIGLMLYGIFIVLFSISIYIFRRRFLPGKFYVVATILFFTLATMSTAIELAQIFTSPLGPTVFVNPIPSEFRPGLFEHLQIALESIFIVSGLLSDALLITPISEDVSINARAIWNVPLPDQIADAIQMHRTTRGFLEGKTATDDDEKTAAKTQAAKQME
ncbi:hypothetical protein GYMLUDRAFT_249701 [Collybiopsis luxurians FD-317 M1]|uniref:Uncharacterized protein n=1 Tax=Collybiopsis luxurians FD-317 M1 TaxID=944289 RepID=A0A0D0CGZ8_9AGAR|nr:hypothetical protein GYMLUDRAFT_249701 [Collybiopsis luxurians FD-317 M1]